MPPEPFKDADRGPVRALADDRTVRLARESIARIRAAAAAWAATDPPERRRRIRDHLERTAAEAAIDPRVFASCVAALLPSPEATADSGVAASPAASSSAGTVDGILSQIAEMTESEREALLSGLRERDLLPNRGRETPVPSATRGQQEVGPLGDKAFHGLLKSLGIGGEEEEEGGPTPSQMAEIEAEADRQGLRRSRLAPDLVATALMHLAEAVGEFSEEHGGDARGMPQVIRQFYQNTPREPILALREYLGGSPRCDDAYLRKYLRDYFRPYRELSERLPRLRKALQEVAQRFDPARIEQASPRKWGGLDHRAAWEEFRTRFSAEQEKGFGKELEATQNWLFNQWLR